ncbi:MAG: hypothetical protein ACI8ZN_001715 [Bacteroidia bacterium]|jgi:hypothetical protein
MKYLAQIFVVLSCLCYAHICQAQTSNIWVFGKGEGIDFNYSPPKAINITMNSQHQLGSYSSTAVSDCNGQILFYASEDIVFNSKSDTMENGLLKPHVGYNSSGIGKYAVIAIPKPYSNGRHLLFYMNSDTFGYNGLYHAEIDMNANNGLGVVVFKDSLVGNIKVISSNLTAIPHANNSDFWIVTTPNETEYQIFKVDSLGLNQSPVVSKGYSQISYFPYNKYDQIEWFNHLGFIKSTHDYKNLIVTGIKPEQSNYAVWMYDFDRETGKLSNPSPLLSQKEIPNGTTGAIEIAPNDSIIYVVAKENLYTKTASRTDLWQINRFSRSTYKSFLSWYSVLAYSLQLAPNGEIYFIKEKYDPVLKQLKPAIYSITKPNNWGNNIQIQYFKDTYYWVYMSLPVSFPPSFQYEFKSEGNGACVDSASFVYYGDTSFKKLIFFFGDGDSALYTTNQIKNGMTVKHKYKTDGLKKLSVHAHTYYCDQVLEKSDTLTVRNRPILSRLKHKSVSKSCFADSLQFEMTCQFTDTLLSSWNQNLIFITVLPTSNKDSTLRLRKAFSGQETGWMQMLAKNNNGCFSSDSIYVSTSKLPTNEVKYELNGYEKRMDGTHPVFYNCAGNSFTFKSLTLNLANGSTVQQSNWRYDYSDILKDSFEFFTNDTNVLQVVITDTNNVGCVATDTFFIAAYEAPKILLDVNQDSFCMPEAELYVHNKSSFSKPSALTYTWALNDDAIRFGSGIGDLDLKIFEIGSHNLKYEVTTKEGCKSLWFEDFVIVAKINAHITVLDSSFCFYENMLRAETTSLSYENISWTMDDELLNTSSNKVKFNNQLYGDHSLILIKSTSFGCAETSIFSYTILPEIESSVRLSASKFCDEDSTVILQLQNNSPTETQNIQLYLDGLLLDDQNLSPRQEVEVLFTQIIKAFQVKSGVHSLHYVNSDVEGKCKLFDSLAFEIQTSPKVNGLNTLAESCVGEELRSTISIDSFSNLASVTWNIGDGQIYINRDTQLTYRYHSKGRYMPSILLQNSNGCATIVRYETFVVEAPVANFTGQLHRQENDLLEYELIDQSKGVPSYWKWTSIAFATTTEQNPVVVILDTGKQLVQLEVSNAQGCTHDTSLVMFFYPKIQFFVPTAISPNRDQLNDVFQFQPAFLAKEYNYQIYNSWGEIVYDTEHNRNSWQAVPGHYVYRLTITDLHDKIHNLSGVLTVLK